MADEKTPPSFLERNWHEAEDQIANTINELGRQANMTVDANQRFQLMLAQSSMWGTMAMVRLARREDERAKLVPSFSEVLKG